MQSLRIILTCVVAAVLYGIVHDQFTAHICVEYFSVFHPPVFSTTSPTLLALGWGVIATWWMGAFLGVLLAFAARTGSRNKMDASELVRPISKLLAAIGLLATVAGLTGYVLASRGAIAPSGWLALCSLPQDTRDSWLIGGHTTLPILSASLEVFCCASLQSERGETLS
jgi:hypothetical protein